jgi:2-oxoisovalerate dehydrogenase E2 component (dihydrolipoyl transacylase)
LRERLNQRFGAQRARLTLLPFVARAVVIAARDFPQVNAHLDDEAGVLTQFGPVHLGIATQTDAGLMVPVLRDAQALDLWQCAAEIARLADAARSGRAVRDELSGSTITITSLGEVAIVGVNRIVTRPVFEGGAVVPRQMMNLSSSFDHRVVDGMVAASFIQAVKALLEHPAELFVA